MGRTCEYTGNRKQLLASEIGACFYCFGEFPPSSVTEWCDENDQGIGQTALCPHCGVDTVVGFNGPVDREWLQQAHKRGFG